MKYLFMLLNETFDHPVYFNGESLITAYATDKEEALSIMQENFGSENVNGHNLLNRVIKINIVYSLPTIISNDDDLGDFEVLNPITKTISSPVPAFRNSNSDEGFLDDPDM